MNQRIYEVGLSTLTIKFGDITTSTADVIVSSDDYLLTMSGGVSYAIRSVGGEAILLDASKNIPAKLGQVIVTSSGALPAKHIFHAITIGSGRVDVDPKPLIEQVTHRCLELLFSLGLDSIAFPAIGAGLARFSYEDVAVMMAKVIANFLEDQHKPIQITIYLFDSYGNQSQMDYIRFFEEFAVRVSQLKARDDQENQARGAEKELSSFEESEEETALVKEQKHKVQRLGILGQERDQLELELAKFANELEESSIRDIEKRLDEIHKQRLGLLSELRPTVEDGVTMFISYAHEDENLRKSLGKHISLFERIGLIKSWHDRMIKPGSEWKGEIDENLENADVIMLLISADFIASDYCYDVELKRALERHEKNQAVVIPVILRPVLWERTPFSKLQALPKDGKPVTDYDNYDKAFTEIAKGLRVAIEDIIKDRT